jgi:hypothetical protein
MKTTETPQISMQWDTQTEADLMAQSPKRWSAEQLNQWLMGVKLVDSNTRS